MMKVWKKWVLRLVPTLTAVGIAALAVGLLLDSAAVSEGVRKGLEVCGNVLIPSLFPFMALSGFISITEYGRILSAPLGWVTTHIYKLPKDLGIIVLLSMLGGYPVGAKMIAGQLEQGRIDRETAARMLCFCVNSGPSFLISAVGAGLFRDRTAGVILFATQTAATLLIGWLTSLRVPAPSGEGRSAQTRNGASALVVAVNGACTGMIAMCAFAVLFSGLLSMLNAGGAIGRAVQLLAALGIPVKETVVTAVVSSFFEVTTGCIAAAKVGGLFSFGLTSAAVSFGGLSVLFQVMSCFGGAPVRFRPLVLSRIAHMGLSTAMAMPLYRAFCTPQPVWLSVTPPLAHADGKTTLLAVCLLAMSTIFLLSVGEHRGNRK